MNNNTTQAAKPSLKYHEDRFCWYCESDDPSSLVRCGNCFKCFCNNKPDKSTQSDIILHLNLSGHTKICHKLDLPGALRCHDCKANNLFELCFSKAKSDASHVYCFGCLKKNGDLLNLDFKSLIHEKRLPYWKARSTFHTRLPDVVILSREQKQRLENEWVLENHISPKEMAECEGEARPPLQPVLKRFENGTEYVDIFFPIIRREQEAEKEIRSTKFQNDVIVTLRKNGSRAYSAYLYPPKDCHFVFYLAPGHKFKLVNKDWEVEGAVKKVQNSRVEFKFDRPVDLSGQEKIQELVRMEYLYVNVSYDRMLDGLEYVESFYFGGEILWHYILDPPEVLPPATVSEKLQKNEDMQKLNEYQQIAVQAAMSLEPITLIQGPPGTGKTLTLFTIIKLLRKEKLKKAKNKILVCAPSNIAVDHLAEILLANGISVCRMFSVMKEASGEFNQKLLSVSLHHQASNLYSPRSNRSDRMLRKRIETEILEEAQVVCCTCITAGDGRLARVADLGYRFKYVIIDEAAQAFEPATILPLMHGAKKVILAGDHKQLAPFVNSADAKKAGFCQSLFERLSEKITPILLSKQYRMHSEIARFPSQHFYESKLVTDAESHPMTEINFPWPKAERPTFFYHIEGAEEITPRGTSYLNRLEGEIVRRVLDYMRRENPELDLSCIGVVAPYSGQKEYLKDLQVQEEIPEGVEIASVDAFQGREKDFIILSCVRSNQETGVGFLHDKKRLNVALTRAKKGLIIIGNCRLLGTSDVWSELLRGYEEEDCLVEGEIGEWRKVDLVRSVGSWRSNLYLL